MRPRFGSSPHALPLPWRTCMEMEVGSLRVHMYPFPVHPTAVLHRDIKPANMLMKSNGYVMISDFGLSVNYTEMTESKPAGTPGYIAPELHQRILFDTAELKCACDWFSLGVSLCNMLNGGKPFKDTSDPVGVAQGLKTAKQSMEAARLSPECVDFTMRLMEVNPTQRLGAGGSKQIFDHPFLAGMDWDAIAQEDEKIVPWVPNSKKKNVDQRLSLLDLEDQLVGFGSDTPIVAATKQHLFENFEFNTALPQKPEHSLAEAPHSKCACILL
eukprot:c12214_g1_i1.p1 GENE.c12214_g1_i1~~c12214_g1_i1.p1  ORF type:complete len:271 (-),score=49.58 c12214_g1_i1:111-923(-)